MIYRSKYSNVRTEVNGVKFDSKAEAGRYQYLLLLEKANIITGLERQKSFELIPKQKGERAAIYKADFCYYEDGNYIVEDVKGVRTADYILKRKLMLFVHNIKVKEIEA